MLVTSGSKETDKDSLSQDLEKIAFKKDRNDLSGIYYFQKPLIHNGNDQGWGPKQTKFKKVLVEVDALAAAFGLVSAMTIDFLVFN